MISHRDVRLPEQPVDIVRRKSVMDVRMRPTASSTGYPKAFWYLLIGMLVNGTATFVLPFEAIYLVGERHLLVSQASAIVGVYGVGSCVSALAGGLLADTI